MGTERFVDLIQKKKNGETLTKEEIDFMITDYVAGKIPDYQWFYGRFDSGLSDVCHADGNLL